MATLKNVLSGTNPVSQMRDMESSGQASRLGDPMTGPDIVFNPTQRLDNQMKTSSQVMNYAASKEMAAQGRTDMRGNVMGYADTLG
jgi:hypothetical protein